MSNQNGSLIKAVNDGDLETVSTLLDDSADVNVKDDGKSVFLISVEKGYCEITNQLIKHGANFQNSTPAEAPLHVAIRTRNIAMVNLLLNAGANVNAKDKFAHRPVFYTINKTFCEVDKDIFKLLQSRGANIYDRDPFGSTLLHMAASNGYVDALEFLLQFNFNVNHSSCHGFLPLHEAAQYGHVKVIQLLVDNGAYVNGLDPIRRATPLHHAVQIGKNVEAAVLLLKLGADVNLECDLYVTPFQCVRPSNYEMLRVFTSHIVRLVTIKSHVCNKNVEKLNSHLVEDLHNQCIKEIQDMKVKKIKDTNITFFYFFTKPLHVLSNYVRNENIIRAYESKEIRIHFPINVDTLNYLFCQAMERRDLVIQCTKILNLSWSRLSPNDLDIICSYLSDIDLKNMISAHRLKLKS